MTVPSTARRAGPFTGTGSAVNYPFGFKVFEASDVTVTTADTNGLETSQTLGSGFSIVLNPDQGSTPGGYVRYAVGGVDTALPSGYRLAITGEGLPFEQAADLPQGGNFDPVVIENALDALEMQIQNLRDKVTRSVTVGVTSSSALALPAPAAGQLLGWNATLDGLVNYAPDASSAAGLQIRLANPASAVDGPSMMAYNPALAYASGLGQFLNYVFGRTADEIAAGVTPSNYAYSPGDVRRYGGVIGTTSANDATNATAYLRACNGGGGKVYFPAGVFRWNSEVLCTRGNITFFGEGKGVSILRPVGWVSGVTVADVYPAATAVLENITVRDLTIDGSLQTIGADDTYGNGVNLVACDKVKIFNIETKDVKFQHIVSTYYVISARQQVSIQVMGCDVEGVRVNQIGIGLEGAGRGAIVSSNTISDCAGDGVHLSYNNVVSAGPGTSVVSDNVIQGATGGTARGIFMGNNVTRVVVSGNIISGFDISIRGSYDSSLGAGSTCGDYIITGNRCSEWTTGGIYVFPMQGTDDSKAHIADNRISSSLASGGSIGVYGSKGSKILDNTIADAATGIQIASGATGARVAGNMNSCTVRVNDLGTGTVIEDEVVTFTPTWTSSGTPPAIGNGSIVGRYVRNGSGWKAWYQITFGSTTTYGTGVYFFSLPFALSGGISFVTGSANVTDTGTNEYTCIARGDNTNGIRLFTTVSPATTVGQTVPFTFGNTDTIYIEIGGPSVT